MACWKIVVVWKGPKDLQSDRYILKETLTSLRAKQKNLNVQVGGETMGPETTCKEKKPEKQVSGLRKWKKINLI